MVHIPYYIQVITNEWGQLYNSWLVDHTIQGVVERTVETFRKTPH